MDVTKPYKFIGFGDMNGPKPYKFIGFRWAFISQTPVRYTVHSILCTSPSPGGLPPLPMGLPTRKTRPRGSLRLAVCLRPGPETIIVFFVGGGGGAKPPHHFGGFVRGSVQFLAQKLNGFWSKSQT